MPSANGPSEWRHSITTRCPASIAGALGPSGTSLDPAATPAEATSAQTRSDRSKLVTDVIFTVVGPNTWKSAGSTSSRTTDAPSDGSDVTLPRPTKWDPVNAGCGVGEGTLAT